MNKIHLALCTMIITWFVTKSYKKITTKVDPREEHIRRKLEEHRRIEAERRDFFRRNPPGARFSECAERLDMMSTPTCGAKMAAIGTASNFEPARG